MDVFRNFYLTTTLRSGQWRPLKTRNCFLVRHSSCRNFRSPLPRTALRSVSRVKTTTSGVLFVFRYISLIVTTLYTVAQQFLCWGHQSPTTAMTQPFLPFSLPFCPLPLFNEVPQVLPPGYFLIKCLQVSFGVFQTYTSTYLCALFSLETRRINFCPRPLPEDFHNAVCVAMGTLDAPDGVCKACSAYRRAYCSASNYATFTSMGINCGTLGGRSSWYSHF